MHCTSRISHICSATINDRSVRKMANIIRIHSDAKIKPNFHTQMIHNDTYTNILLILIVNYHIIIDQYLVYVT